MRHVTLTCKHHTNLRWTCKSIAYSPGHGYNGARNIFFAGAPNDPREHPDAPDRSVECPCPASDLVLAPEDEWSILSLEEQRDAVNND